MRHALAQLRNVITALAVVVLGMVVIAGPASATADTCNGAGYEKYDSSSGTDQPIKYDGSTVGSMSWGTYPASGDQGKSPFVEYSLDAGYEVQFCIKAGPQIFESPWYAGPATDAVWSFENQNATSHVGYRVKKAALPRDAAASVSTTPPTCETGEQLVLGDVVHASWGTPTLTEGPGDYSVSATADPGHLFADGEDTKTFAGTLQGPVDPDDESCRGDQPEPKQVSEQHESCDLSEYGDFGAGTITRDGTRAYVWDEESHSWVLGDEVVWDEWEFTGYTDEEYAQNCGPEQPEPKQVSEQHESCDLSEYGDFGAGTITRDGTQAYVWDAEKREWVLGDEVVWGDWEFTAYTDEEYFDNCAPGQPEPIVREVAGQAESCELGGVSTWTDVYTTEFVWDAESQEWVPGEETGPVRTDESFTEYTDEEYFDTCAPPEPPEETRDVAGVQASCKIGGQQSYTLTWTTEYEWNAETREWESHETGPVRTEGEFIAYTPHQLRECDKSVGPNHDTTDEPEVKGVQAAVPTAVDAGLGSTGTPAGPGRNPLWLLVTGAGVGLLGFAAIRRRGTAGR